MSTILPIPGKRNILVTSALPYVNNVPHLGNLIGCVLSADVFTRYARQRGYNTLFICGTDEYGTATELKAKKEGLTCKETCDKYYTKHKEVYDWFGIKFDHFGRTTNRFHESITHDIFQRLYQNKYIKEKDILLPYCAHCNRNLSDRLVRGICPRCDGKAKGDQCDLCGIQLEPSELKEAECTLCGKSVQLRHSPRHLFLNLPELSERHTDWFNQVKCNWAENAVHTVESDLKDKCVKPVCISRELSWGTLIPLSGYEGRVFHCWFDAPIGYISITADYYHSQGKDPELWKGWWRQEIPTPESKVELWQFLGKDNITFHAVNFPSTLLGTDEKYTLVHQICSTDHLKYEGKKFSKSDGVGVFCDEAIALGIPPDVFRFYLISCRPEQSDSSFYWRELRSKNNFLREKLGSLVTRILSNIHKKFDGIIPDLSPEHKFHEHDIKLIDNINTVLAHYINAFESRLAVALEEAKKLVDLGHEYLSFVQPYSSSCPPERIKECLYLSVNLLRYVGLLFYPFIPSSVDIIWDLLNLPVGNYSYDILSFKLPFKGVIKSNHRFIYLR